MFASIPFILLLILQGFARQDCAELLLGSQDLANAPAHARSIQAFDCLLAHFSLAGKVNNRSRIQKPIVAKEAKEEIVRFSSEESGNLQTGFLEIQRSRDGPVA